MKTTATLLTLLVLLSFASTRCFAMREIAQVSKDQAKELGIYVRATAAGPEAAWVSLEFKPQGKLKDFSQVEMEVRDGQKLLIAYAALAEKRSRSGNVTVTFMANRGYLEKITLVIVTGSPMNYTGHELSLREFIELDKIH